MAVRMRRAVSRLRANSGPANGRQAGSNRSTLPRPIQRAAGCGSARNRSRYSAASIVLSDDNGLPLATMAHSSSRSASRRYARRVASLRAPRISIQARTACRSVLSSAWCAGTGARFRPAEPSSSAGTRSASSGATSAGARATGRRAGWPAGSCRRGVMASGDR